MTPAELCRRKVAHRTIVIAKYRAHLAMKKHGRVQYIYRCPVARHWHLSTRRFHDSIDVRGGSGDSNS